MTERTQLPPVLDALFCALRDPVPSGELGGKSRGLGAADWQLLADLAIDHHRVGPRVWHALADLKDGAVPPAVAERFAAEARQASVQALVSKAETGRILQAFNRIDIEPCLLKGWALEEELSGRIGRRVTRDIDLLIESEALPAAAEVLQELGYRSPSTEAFGTGEGLEPFLRFAHHVVFLRPTSRTMVELHLRPFRNPHVYGSADLETDRRVCDIGDAEVRYRAPTPASNFVYLALHGYSHRWKRAKWLIDMPPLLKRLSQADWRQVDERARERALERTLGIALVLSRDLLEVEVPEAARALLARADGSYLSAACCRELLAMEPDRPTLRRWLDSHVVNLSSSPRLPVIGASIQTLIVRESDVLPSRLAGRFQWLHYLSAVSNIPKRLGHRMFRRP